MKNGIFIKEPNYPIVKKAYELDLDMFIEGYLSDNVICYADNINQAKSKLLKAIIHDNWYLRYSGDKLSYLNIPVKRRKLSDEVMFEGEVVIRGTIERTLEERQRIAKLDEILYNENIKYCYIIKGGYYYRPNSCGYTSLRYEAGVFPKDEAVSHAKSVRELRIEWVDIEELENNLL